MSPVFCMENKENMDMEQAYRRAARIYAANRTRHVRNETVSERWIEGTPDFWFAFDTPREGGMGVEYRRYDAERQTVCPLFDHAAMAAALSPWAETADSEDLPIRIHDVDGREGKIYFSIRGADGEFVYMPGGSVQKLPFAPHEKGTAPSPDRRYSAYAEKGDLYCRCNETGWITRLTHDGSDETPYARRYHQTAERLIHKEPHLLPLGLRWSPDSRRILTYRVDYRGVGKMHLVQTEPIDGSDRPLHAEYPCSLPGDEKILTGRLTVIDVSSGEVRPVTLNGEPVDLFLLALFDAENDQVQWSVCGRWAYLLRYDRYFKRAEALLVDTETATARVMAVQEYRTFGFTEYFGCAAQEAYMDSGLRYLPDTSELLWLVERDDYASIWLVDANTGAFLRDLTPGPYTARRIRFVDEHNRLLYFSASGREAGVDPYMQQLYCVSLDGGQPEQLTPEAAEHMTRFCPKGGYFIDTFSTIQTPPITRVCDVKGRELRPIATADLSAIEERGYRMPEPFQAVARDGKTPIYGVIIKPYGFDPEKKYPVVDYVYGGSQRINVPKGFAFHDVLEFDPQGGLQSLAQLGFVGVIIDGLATPLRAKAIHDMAYGHAEECCGLADHVCALQQLAAQYSWIDIERAGVWGSSGGGYAAVRAMLQFPGVYKVGVALCGNHDQARYHAHWGDRWMGPYSQDGYYQQANRNFADRLRGKLLLVHGDMDDNVHPSASIQLAGALARAGKETALLLYPNSGHGVEQNPAVVHRRWDFFVRHLLGREPPEGFSLEKAVKEQN